MKINKCPFCNGQLKRKDTMNLIVLKIIFKERYICEKCKSLCLKKWYNMNKKKSKQTLNWTSLGMIIIGVVMAIFSSLMDADLLFVAGVLFGIGLTSLSDNN